MGSPLAGLPGAQGGSSSNQRQRRPPPLIALYLYTIWVTHFGVLGDRVIEGAGEYRPRYRTGLLNRASRSPALALDQLAGRLNTSKHTKGQYQLPDQLPGQVDILNQPAIRATGAATRAGQLR